MTESLTHLTSLPDLGSVPDLSRGPVLLYDGSCGVCARSVQWILTHERGHALRFAALQSPVGQALRSRAGVSSEVDSLIWVEAGADQAIRGYIWSDAILAVLSYVGGPWRALGPLRLVPRPLRDAAYRLFAHYRLHILAQSCLLPSSEERVRFLGTGAG